MQLAAAVEATQSNLSFLNQQLSKLGKRVCVLEAKAKLSELGRGARLPVEFRSQFGEDVLIWNLLDGQMDGYIIECGAFDGVHFAVSSVFDALGWDCLCVEAIPERFEQCRKNRPHSRVENAALSHRKAPATATFTVTDDPFGGMLSYLTTSDFHKNAAAVKNAPQRSVTVPCTTMNALLETDSRLKGPVDVAVIDVEGGEVDLLDGFDLHKWKPRLLLLEDNEMGQDPKLGNYMASQPYVFVGWHDVNRVYVRADETALLNRAQAGW